MAELRGYQACQSQLYLPFLSFYSGSGNEQEELFNVVVEQLADEKLIITSEIKEKRQNRKRYTMKRWVK